MALDRGTRTGGWAGDRYFIRSEVAGGGGSAYRPGMTDLPPETENLDLDGEPDATDNAAFEEDGGPEGDVEEATF